MTRVQIRKLQPRDLDALAPELASLLIDAVDDGASVGFLPPLDAARAESYWTGLGPEMQSAQRIVLAALLKERLVGTVQLALAPQENGAHRASVQRLIVHRSVRRQGIGQALMHAAESFAKETGRTLLLLDTRKGEAAESLYVKLGYRRIGEVPGYARGGDGTAHASVFFFRTL